LSVITTEYKERISQLHRELGIPADYQSNCGLPLYPEPLDLEDTEPDYYQRPQQLTPVAHQAWLAMKQAAADEKIVLHLISAYRSVEYQCALIKQHLQAGRDMDELLTKVAAPGHSEHHSGRAIDISTDGCAALELEFAETKAYTWLCSHAAEFGFVLSFPANNPFGISYEPWHWCYQV